MGEVLTLPVSEIQEQIKECSDLESLSKVQKVLSQRIAFLSGVKDSKAANSVLEKGQRLGIGIFEEIVLQAVFVLKERAYGLSVSKLVQEWREQKLANATVYEALNILEKKGFLNSTLAPPTVVRGGRTTKYYRITEQGLEKLNEVANLRERIKKDVEELASTEKARG